MRGEEFVLIPPVYINYALEENVKREGGSHMLSCLFGKCVLRHADE